MEILRNAYAIRVLQWDQVHSSTDPDMMYKPANLSYNRLCYMLKLPEHKSVSTLPEGHRHTTI